MARTCDKIGCICESAKMYNARPITFGRASYNKKGGEEMKKKKKSKSTGGERVPFIIQ